MPNYLLEHSEALIAAVKKKLQGLGVFSDLGVFFGSHEEEAIFVGEKGKSKENCLIIKYTVGKGCLSPPDGGCGSHHRVFCVDDYATVEEFFNALNERIDFDWLCYGGWKKLMWKYPYEIDISKDRLVFRHTFSSKPSPFLELKLSDYYNIQTGEFKIGKLYQKLIQNYFSIVPLGYNVYRNNEASGAVVQSSPPSFSELTRTCPSLGKLLGKLKAFFSSSCVPAPTPLIAANEVVVSPTHFTLKEIDELLPEAASSQRAAI